MLMLPGLGLQQCTCCCSSRFSHLQGTMPTPEHVTAKHMWRGTHRAAVRVAAQTNSQWWLRCLDWTDSTCGCKAVTALPTP